MSAPRDFIWGAATSSHQVEGNNRNNDWWHWEQEHPRLIRDGRRSGDAAQWWEGGAELDLSSAVELGHGAHRLSLEWSRLEPSPDRFDDAAFNRYGDILHQARTLGLRLYVTLNHFTLPRWVGARGWLEPHLAEAFARYCARAVNAFRGMVELWGTLNEPSVLALKGYARRDWPPARGNAYEAAIALERQLVAHALAYRTIKATTPDARVGIVLNVPQIGPENPASRLDQHVARVQRWLSSGAILEALATGRCSPPVGLRPRHRPELARSLDHLGINYYGRYLVRFSAGRPATYFGHHVQTPTIRTETSDWGQPSADGLLAALADAQRLGVPLYVTENGVFDPEDAQRPQFIHDHVQVVLRAAERGIDVRGYFHWSLIDNFEWAQGWSTPFGLIELDPKTQSRKVRPSARILEQYARAHLTVADDGKCQT